MKRPFTSLLPRRLLVRLGAQPWLAAFSLCNALVLAGPARAQQRVAPVVFQEDAAARAAAQTSPLAALLRQARPFSLDPAAVQAALAAAPLEGTGSGTPVVLALPLPDGSTARFALRQTAVMAPALAARYPAIRTYSGAGLDDATASIRLSLDPGGLHAQVLAAGHGAVYLDPVSRTDNAHYLSYDVSARQPPGPLPGCTAPAAAPAAAALARPATTNPAAPVTAARNNGQQLYVLRLAVATTDEYTAARGNTVASALASVVTTVNRVNGLYERELGIRLELVADNDRLIAANLPGAPDSFSNNNAPPGAMTENQLLLDRIVGTVGYDFGHVFGTYGGGYAVIGGLCDPDFKAQGESGLASPVGDGFDIQFVAHEMGHQLGALHTFNADNAGSCTAAQRAESSAFEPGSGSTLMGYPGTCGSENLQSSRDAYFHAASYAQIQRTLENASCSRTLPTGNNVAVVSVGGVSKKVPIGTPFKLTAYATDAENDALLYNWEELDAGAAVSLTAAQTTNARWPLFRSYPAGSSSTRYFPRLSTLITNGNDVAERLPTVTRNLSFGCLVRDLHSGTQGVVGAAAAGTTLILGFTAAAGPFVVTTPNTAVSWPVSSTQTVTWDVAGTDANGVDCASVNIRLSTDGGLTYPHLLLVGTPNDGTQTISVPNVPTTTARLLVEAADNVFFDISNASFTITALPGAPTLSSISPGAGTVGSTVILTGSNLAGITAVAFEGVSAGFTNVTATSLTATVANALNSTAAVTVRTPIGISNSLPFTMLPTITGISPTSGYLATSQLVGTTLTITGSGFFGATGVRFNNPYFFAYGLRVDATGQSISFELPFLLGHSLPATGTITVLTPRGEITSTFTFTVLRQPCRPPRLLTIGSITSTSARLSFTQSLGDPLAYVLSTSPPSTVIPDFGDNDLIAGLTPGTTYTARLVSNCGEGDSSQAVTVRFSTPPSGFTNDDCAGAILLVTSQPGEACVLTSGQLGAATQSQPPVWCSGLSVATAPDVWYRFVATGPVHTVSIGGGFNGVLEAFQGGCGGLVSLECVDFSGTGESLTLLGLTPGTTYWVRYYTRTLNSATTITACVSTPSLGAATCATAPTALAMSNVTSSAAMLSFVAAPRAVSYTISAVPRITARTVSAGPVSFSGLQSGTRYVLSISSTCTDGSVSAPVQLAFTTALPDVVIRTSTGIAARAYRNVTITSTGSASPLFANQGYHLWIGGTMRVERGGEYFDGGQSIEGPGNFVLEPGTTLNLSHLEGISQSGPSGAVQVTGSRSFGNNANFNYNPLIDNSSGVTGTGLPDTVQTLAFFGAPNSTYTLSRNVAVRERLETIDVSLLLGSANLLLLSDRRRTAYVLDYNAQVRNTGTGRATMQRYVSPTTSYAGPGYRHYSSPVSGATVAGLAVPGQFAPLVNSAYNALPTPSLPAGQFPTVFRYQESRLTAAFPGFDTGWESPASLTEPLAIGRGYTVNIAPSATVALTGELNSDSINTGPLRAGPGPNGGWHLLGNPYPAPISIGSYQIDSLRNGLAHAAYVFEPSSQYGGFYRSYVNGITTDGNGYLLLPAMQGFFMRALQDVPEGFTFTPDMRAYGEDTVAFHRNGLGSTPSRPTLRLSLSGATGTDHTVVYLQRGATITGVDARYDAAKLTNPGTTAQLASQMPGPGNEPLAINGLPDLTASTDTRVPLTLRLPAPGSYQLRVAELSHFDPNVPVWLLDHARGARTDLRQQPSYGFTAAQAGTLNGRFELLLGRSTTALTTATTNSNSFSVWPNPATAGCRLQLALDAPATVATATLTTLLGQPVARVHFGGSTGELVTAGLAAGTYLLVVQVAGQVAGTRRVVLE